MRRRWLYTSGGEPLPEPVEVTADVTLGGERMPLFTDRFMEGDRAPDGTDISSRQKRKDWMKATGSADASDFTQHWQRSAEERASLPKDIGADLHTSILKLKGY